VQELDQIDVTLPESPAPVGVGTAPRQNPAPGRRLCCEVITDFRRLESLSLEWQRLWESDCRAEIFQTPGWAKAWWRSYGQQFTLCSVAVHEEDELIGVVPLVKRENVVQFLGTPQADYADIICEESRVTEVLAAALRTLLNWSEGWSECVLQHLAKHSRIVRCHQDLPQELRRRLHLVPTESYQTIVLRDNREEVFKELLGKHHTRRRQNKLDKAGRVQFRHLETKVEAHECLNDFFRHHVRRRAAIGKKSSCASPEFCNFLRALVDEIEPNDRLRFGVLELDSSALAWALGFRVNGKFLLYQHTFDVDAWDYSPGEVLLLNLLEYARKKITREFDFGKGQEAYKNRYANHTRETFSLFIERPGLVGEMHGLLRETQGSVHLAVGKLERAVTAYRPALRLFRWFRAWTKEALSSARQPRKNKALLKYFWDLTSRLFNKTFTGKRAVLAFVSNRDAEPNTEHLVSAPSNEEVSIKMGRLGDLVDVALECPNMLALSQIQRCRQRLKRGDRVYIVRQNSHATLLSWVVTNMPTNSLDGALRPAGDRSAILMNECTSESRLDSPTSYRQLLFLLRVEAASKKSELIVHCRADQSTLRSELQRQGFLPTSQSVKGVGRSR
jgi:CelD/BcsL family acetyltransferase involved in cellulose biosynthesis